MLVQGDGDITAWSRDADIRAVPKAFCFIVPVMVTAMGRVPGSCFDRLPSGGAEEEGDWLWDLESRERVQSLEVANTVCGR